MRASVRASSCALVLSWSTTRRAFATVSRNSLCTPFDNGRRDWLGLSGCRWSQWSLVWSGATTSRRVWYGVLALHALLTPRVVLCVNGVCLAQQGWSRTVFPCVCDWLTLARSLARDAKATVSCRCGGNPLGHRTQQRLRGNGTVDGQKGTGNGGRHTAHVRRRVRRGWCAVDGTVADPFHS
jgi:hypothetical protein